MSGGFSVDSQHCWRSPAPAPRRTARPWSSGWTPAALRRSDRLSEPGTSPPWTSESAPRSANAHPWEEQRGSTGESENLKGGDRCGGLSYSGLSHVSPLEGNADFAIWGAKQGELRVHNVLAEFLGFNEDVEVGFFQLLGEHAEDIIGGRKISQVVDNQVKKQLQRDTWSERVRLRDSPTIHLGSQGCTLYKL